MSSRRDATISALAVGRPALVETAGEFSPVRHVARIFGTQGIENLQQRILGAALARGLLQEVFERQIQVAFERDATSLKSYSSEDGLCGQDVLERLEDCVGLVESIGATQEIAQCDRGVEIGRVEFERGTERRLVTLAHEFVDLRSTGREFLYELAHR